MIRFVWILALAAPVACERGAEPPPESAQPAPAATERAAPASDRAALLQRAQGVFKPVPTGVASAENPITEEKVALGRMLYYEPRLSTSAARATRRASATRRSTSRSSGMAAQRRSKSRHRVRS